MDLSLQDSDFLNSFDYLGSFPIDASSKHKLDLFVVKINGNEFYYQYLTDNLIDPLINFSISRKTYAEHLKKPGQLTKKAKDRFVNYVRNNGELGELLLYCFLESHLGAPKILSKLELKTSTEHYVNGSDGVHILKLPNGDFQLIFGESKTEKDITTALRNALRSIYDFKNETNKKGAAKSGLPYEKSLISDHLEKETFSEDERKFIKQIIYPTRDTSFQIDDAFGIFVGYETSIDPSEKAMTNADFRALLHQRIKDQITEKLSYISDKINEHGLSGHNFYIYIIPFTDLDASRKAILKGAME